MPDRNKTELTQNITRLAALWLYEKGFKPVETEVGVARRWVADIAGVGCLTQTEILDLKLSKRRRKDEDWRTWYETAIQPWNRMMTALIEVKTSVGDFRGDRKWKEPWPCSLCFVAMPEGMIPDYEWPEGWGVLLYSADGSRLNRYIAPTHNHRAIPDANLLNVIHAIAVRRDHHTRYARQRELQQAIRLSDADRNNSYRLSNCVRFVRDVLAGKFSVEDAARRNGIRKVPEWIIAELKEASITVSRPVEAAPVRASDSASLG